MPKLLVGLLWEIFTWPIWKTLEYRDSYHDQE